MSTTPKRDCISSLPPELLSEIFDHAYRDLKAPTTPISRTFLPFQRLTLFRQLRVTSAMRLEALIDAHEANCSLGGLTKELEVENVDGQTAMWNERRLKGFFATLVNLERLKLGANSSSLISFILSFRIARSDLPRLESLEFQVSLNEKRPFDSKLYRYLDSYPTLHRLEISTLGDHKFNSSSRGGVKLAKIRDLILRGEAVDHVKTISFLENFPQLVTLTLDTLTSHAHSYPALVANLPVSLKSLTLRNLGFYDGYCQPCDGFLPRLVNLEYLYLGEGTFTRDVINPLGRLSSLSTLGFGRGATQLEPPRLEEMILGPVRLSRLEKVIFDQVEGHVGWQIREDSADGATVYPDPAQRGPGHVGPGWVVPRFDYEVSGGAFTERAVAGLVERIKAQGIVVEGTTVEAFGIDEQHELEITTCAIAYAWQTGDFDECREMFGDEMVDEMIADEGRSECDCRECLW